MDTNIPSPKTAAIGIGTATRASRIDVCSVASAATPMTSIPPGRPT